MLARKFLTDNKGSLFRVKYVRALLDLVAGMLKDLGCEGYDFQIQTFFEASHIASEIRELPITFRDRESGESKLALEEVLNFASQLYSRARKERCLPRALKI